MTRTTVVLATLFAASLAPLAAQQLEDTIPVLQERRLDGPRMGFTYTSWIRPGSKTASEFADRSLDRGMSLFGWHFEQIVRPKSGGPMFVIQEVALVAGVDQGLFAPSITVLFGIRFPSGFEFGMGPNGTPLGAGMAAGIGKSLRYGGVAIPLNLGVVKSHDGFRATFLFGYAIRRS